ncbi:Alpha/beta hydrolase family protein [Gemmata obscuriglobus]|uniref:Alpha/beta hydrolase n=1 Tax=Gemmata obscuriglobus TaxID=114 RepID=A0A2Z3HED0_9BACT|nr:alpha/beta hydrolase [Gemmata obscuriglobus]AWM41947.1 alpha/beta hydrolase [Gemmata obscuriglobus]QEG32071.1 Alpha/beta hydrolase family protein [Gemmata obscuriglobus]VTS11422.1 Phospholipase/Carboxylesterase OS=Chthoniobacter flavus Ellin428 GN=CfE428DRAFT_1534 PE=4 SV=1: Abhydrolase_5 [Gemmata obscuriglobus UQM 2246]
MSEAPQRSLWRRARRWAVLFLITYLGIVIVFWFLERRLVFVPTSTQEEWLEPEDRRSQDVSFDSADGNKIAGRWIPPETPHHGAVLVANGNGGNLTHRGGLAADLRLATGAGVLLFDYPGYGKSSGTPSENGCYAAGEAAYKWLTDEQKVATSRIILYGESLGGGTAVELATKREHRALVLIYTFTSLPDAAKNRFPFLPAKTLMRTRFDNLSKIAKCPRPVFFVHGRADTVVPFSHSEQLYVAANQPKEFVRLDGIGHVRLPGELYLPALVSFLNRHAP